MRRPIVIALIVVALAGLTYGVRRYLHSRLYESTDDAFISADVVDISPRLASNVMKVLEPRVKGRADGKLVNDVVKSLLA